METKETHQGKIVLGLGNTLRGDDGIGIVATMELAKKFAGRAEFVCTEEMGFALLDYLSGYEEALIIDSICTMGGEAGEIHRFSLEDFPPQANGSAHYLGLPEAAQLAREMRIPFPANVQILGVEISQPFDISPSLSPELQAKLPGILGNLEDLLRELL